MNSKTSRRDFIRLSTLVGGGLFLPPLLTGCNSCQDNRYNDIPLLEKADGPFDVWRQMIKMLEKSPDHFIGRRKALIASKDPEAMTAFVRDHIQVIPTSSFMRNLRRETAYGTEAALRCGMATPREKAEILKDMLTEAGFKARVILETTQISEERFKDIVFRDYHPDFNPPISKKQFQEWRNILGAKETNGEVETIDNIEKASAAWAQKLLAGMKDKSFRKDPYKFKYSPREVPGVAFKDDGEEKYAHVFDPDVPFGELHPENPDKEIRDAQKIGRVEGDITLTLYCRTALDPHNDKHELLSGTWAKEDLAGSKIFLKFMNNMDFKQQVSSTISDITSFTPVFSFQKIGASPEFMTENSFVGEPFDLNAQGLLDQEETGKGKRDNTLSIEDLQPVDADSLEQKTTPLKDTMVAPSGNTLKVTGADSLQPSTPGRLQQQNPDSLQTSSNDTLSGIQKDSLAVASGSVKDVRNLEAQAVPKAFPKVLLELSPTDDEGKIIGGLQAQDFQLTDNGKPITGKMTQNRIEPQLLLLYDISLSMPKKYRDKKQIEAFHKEMSQRIFELYPNSTITLKETGSNLYTTMLKAKQSDYDLVMYCTDGDNNDKFDPVYTQVYESGQPLIILEVLESHKTYKELQKNIKNLISLPAVDQDRAIEEVKKAISRLSFPPYIFSYSSFDEEKPHTIKVHLNEQNISAEANFKFPEPNDEFLGNRIIGLYLKIEGSGMKTVKRTLAGWEDEFYKYKASRDLIHEVHEMLLGQAVLSFEREAPTLSIRLTEYLTVMLSHEKWVKAQQQKDTEQAITYLEEGVMSYPSSFLSMTQPLINAHSEESITYPKDFRASILKIKPGLYKEQSRISFDYLPLANYTTLSRSGDDKEMFTTNLEKTLQFAVLEAQFFKDSTLSRLKGKPIVERGVAEKEEDFQKRLKESENLVIKNRILRERGGYYLFDHSLESSAYFNIKSDSGEAFALLPDGTGGGGNDIQAQLDHIQNVVDEYERVIDIMSPGLSGSLGVVALYSVTLVKLYAAASESIVLMETGDLDKKVEAALVGLACNLYKDLVYLAAGPVGGILSGLEDLIGMLGGDIEVFSCSG